MAKRIVEEVESNGMTYEPVCEHGVHFGGCNCWVCHPEKLSSSAWLFSPEMDAAYAAAKGGPTRAAPDTACTCPKSDTDSILYYSNDCKFPGHAAPVS